MIMKYSNAVVKIFIFLLFTFLFSGCIKDNVKGTHSYTFYTPQYKTKDEVRSNIKSNPAVNIKAPGKIVIRGNYIFLNEINKGIHVIDNSNPSSPVNIAFIHIPGNVDLAINGNILYADLYTDLVALDISDPHNAHPTKIVEGVFPDRFYGLTFSHEKNLIITDWVRHDTTIDFNLDTRKWIDINGRVAYMNVQSPNKSSASIGIAGSLARFALTGNYLYTVGETDLNVFNIIKSEDPIFENKVSLGWNVETIYPFKNKLFIGSRNGMYIYNINSTPRNPVKVGEFTHARSCDPVIADESFAFVTLHSGTKCQGYSNQLDVIQLNDLSNAKLVKTYNMNNPQGLSKDKNLLFICDGASGLKVFDASDVLNLKLIKHFPDIKTYDVIAYNKIALVVGQNGLYQYDYSNVNNIELISRIDITN